MTSLSPIARLERWRGGLPTQGLMVVAFFGLALAILFWGHGGQDDTYITYWPALTLADHGKIVNYNGIRLEQSSSLSLVVLLALIFKVTPFAMPTIGYVASLAAAGLTALVAVRLAVRMGLESRAGILAAILTAPSFSYWATSGMETPLVSLSALWFIDVLAEPAPSRPRAHRARLCLAALLFAAVRPEAPLLLGGLCILFVALAGIARRSRGAEAPPVSAALARTSVGFAAIAFVFAFRRLYFDAWWPNPAVIKAGGFDARGGALYLWNACLSSGGFPIVAFVAGGALVVARSTRALPVVSLLVGALGLGQLAFVVASGGDWMLGARFLAPVVPALVLIGFVAIEAAARGPRARAGLAASYCALNLMFALQLVHQDATDGQPLWTAAGAVERLRERVGPVPFATVELLNRSHRRDAVVISELLPIVDLAIARTPARRINVMTGQAGMIPYHLSEHYYERMNVIDLWSITDRQLLDCFPEGTVETNNVGSAIGTYRPLAEHEQLTARCGLPLPDVFFNADVEPHMPALFAKLGYDVVYRQVGRMENGTSLGGFIAVKHELAQALGLRTKSTWRWDLD